MKFGRRLVILALLVLWPPWGQAWAQSEPPLIVSQDHAWPPFAFRDARGEPQGLLVEMWREIAASMGREVEFRLVDWPDTILQVRDGGADVHGGLIASEERGLFFDFSPELMPLSAFAFGPGYSAATSLAAFSDEPVGVTAASFELEYLNRHYPDLTLAVFQNNEKMVQAAVAGGINVFVADYPVGMYLLDRYAAPTDFRPLELLYTHSLVAGFRKGDTATREAVTEALASLDPEALRRLQQRWMRSETVEVLPPWFWPALAGSFALAFMGGYSLLLLRQRRRLVGKVARNAEALAESENLLRGLADNAAAGIFILKGQRFLRVNPAMSRMSGYSADELLAMDFPALVHPVDREMVKSRGLARQRGEAVPRHYEFRALTKSGETRWIDMTADAVAYRGGQVSVGTLFDITERKLLDERLKASELRFRTLVENAPDIIYTLSEEGVFLFVSPNLPQQTGYPVEALLGKPMDYIVHPDDVPRCQRFLARILATGEKGAWIEYRIRHRDGGWRWHVSATSSIREKGTIQFMGIGRDITRQKQIEEDLRYQDRFNQLLVRLSGEFLNAGPQSLDDRIEDMLREAGRFFEVDRAYLYRFSDDGLRMTNTHEWCGPGAPSLKASQIEVPLESHPWWWRQMRERLQAGKPLFIADVDALPAAANIERDLLREQGVASLVCVPVRLKHRIVGFFGLDVCQRRQWRDDQADLLTVLANLISEALARNMLEEELRRSAVTDPLTGLNNRRYLLGRLNELIGEHRRRERPFAVVMFDIDHFKQINDSHGHQAGDFILEQFAQSLRRGFRLFDIVARYGGEEFVVVLIDANKRQASEIARRVAEDVGTRHLDFEGRPLRMTVSGGVADVNELDEIRRTPQAIIDLADRRLYEAKRAGRNRIVDAEASPA